MEVETSRWMTPLGSFEHINLESSGQNPRLHVAVAGIVPGGIFWDRGRYEMAAREAWSDSEPDRP